MDWDLKTPSWDFLEFERETTPNIVSLVGSSSGVHHHHHHHHHHQNPIGDCSVDLKLGRLGDLGDGMLNNWKDPRESAMSASSSSPLGPLKRARAPGNGAQTVSCLVDGCTADLGKCRDYHRRHKVCEGHSKTPRVMVGGQEQRFCQQCSRFHLLIEFDEEKRSCRKRLDGHNRRRRKPQPESLTINSGSLFSGHHQGTRLLPFANGTHVLPSTNMVSSSWTPVIKTEEDTGIYSSHPSLHYVDRQNLYTGSFSRSYKAEKQFPFLPVSESSLGHRTTAEASVCQPLLNTISSSESGASGRKMFSGGLSRVFDSDCALSLLSSPPTQTSGITMNHVVQPDHIPMGQPLVPGLQYGGLGRYQSGGMEGESVGSVLVSNVNDAEIHCHGIFSMGPDGSSQDGVQQTLPFSWD